MTRHNAVHPNLKMSRQHRRSFLKRVALGLSTAAFSRFESARAASAVRPESIIDTHTHFYDPNRAQGVPWPPKDDKLLYRPVLPANYKALPTSQAATGTVVVEASSWLEDNQWILDLAERERFIVGFVGNLPVGTGAFVSQLSRFAANPVFRGIRIGANRLKEGLSDRRFLKDIELLVKRDLVLDLLGAPAMLPDVSKLAQENPELRIVIDHVANVKIDGKTPPAEWIRGIEFAARQRHVVCKVSGLVEGTGRTDGTAPSDTAFYKPVLDVIWEAFGEDRLIYGSNWPVSERFASLATVQNIVQNYFEPKGKAAIEKVFWKNAQTVYRWGRG